MSDLGKMSFVMPAHDIAWRTIERAVDSILDQDYKNWELIIVKNGLIDKGKIRRKVKQYLTDKRIKLVILKEANVCNARNKGAEIATGDFYSFFSSDFVLKPGMLRYWLEMFRDNPEYGMVYGGYDWTDENYPTYRSQEFDAYLLERGLNYIDGGFPVRKEYYLPWDVNCKSLNDWEWVIRLVRNGCKPLYSYEIAYEADLPKPAGLSSDSGSNWVERVNYIKNKLGIPNSPICVSSLGAPFHGIRTAKILDADFKPFPTMKPHEYKLLYLLGFYVGGVDSAKRHFEVFNNTYETDIKKVIHWIGSDIQTMMGLSWGANHNLVDTFKRENFIHLCECGSTQEELKAMGIDAEILALPIDHERFKITELPEKPVVAIYAPESNMNAESQYNLVLMRDIAESMPDVQFKFFGGNQVKTVKNMEYVGYIDTEKMPEFIKECSMLLRCTVHDGLPISPIEFLLSGRDTMVTMENMSCAHYLGTGRVDERNYHERKAYIIEVIRKIIKEPLSAEEKLIASQYWRNKTDRRLFKVRMNDILKGKNNG